MTDDTSWRTAAFRQSVVAKIDEAIRQSGMSTSRNSLEMENHVFQKAKNREEYLGFVARLILHVREIKPKPGGGMAGPGQGQAGPGMPDPINALQNLASQGSRNSMMNMGPQPGQMGGPQQGTATNLLQTLNRGPAQQMMMGNMPGNMPNNMPGNLPLQYRQLSTDSENSVSSNDDSETRKRKKNDDFFEKTLEIMNRPDDDFYIFGQYVASSLRNLKAEESRKKMKRQIQRIILDVEEDDDLKHQQSTSNSISSTSWIKEVFNMSDDST